MAVIFDMLSQYHTPVWSLIEIKLLINIIKWRQGNVKAKFYFDNGDLDLGAIFLKHKLALGYVSNKPPYGV